MSWKDRLVEPQKSAFFHFVKNVKRHCCVLKPFLKQHWCLENISSKKEDICLNMLLLWIFDRVDEMLSGLYFFSHLSAFLLQWGHICKFKAWRKQRRFNGSINTSAQKVSKYVNVFFNNLCCYIRNLTSFFSF